MIDIVAIEGDIGWVSEKISRGVAPHADQARPCQKEFWRQSIAAWEMLRFHRLRPHKAHVTPQNVEELRQPVDARST